MFPLHDNSRRRICLAAFFGLCVAPTLAVLAFGLSRRLPTHARAEARRLTWQLGANVSLDRVEHLRPGVVRYEGLELSDPETGVPILRCPALRAGWRTSTDGEGQGHRSLVLIASAPEIRADQLRSAWKILEGVLTRRAGCGESNVQLKADNLTLRQGDASHALTAVQATIERLPDGSQADVQFRLTGLETPEPIRIWVVRNHQIDPPATGVGFSTGGGALPCSLVALAAPQLDVLGPNCQFHGHFWVNETSEGPAGQLVGDFTNVDLEGLLNEHFSHRLHGPAHLRIEESRIRKGRIEEATGLLVAGPGEISRPLLDAAIDRLGMPDRLEPSQTAPLASFEQLAVSFHINSDGLQLWGKCPPTDSGTILVGRFGTLLGEPYDQPVPIAALLQALAPTDQLQVPATRPTGWLISRLPVPQADAARTASASEPAAR
ncbi:MAG: hypothetical protein HQ582_25325 [Planctomycetes bacterium]|nr:hypothetical protein [Planctomycetota bacterium]